VLAGDPSVLNRTGETLTAGDLAREYGFTDIDGTYPKTLRTELTSLAHGWAAGPTAALSAYVLGMRPASPGWAKWLVEPQPGDLRFAHGSVGTPAGRLGVRWDRDADGRPSFRISVRVPRGTTGTVAVPLLGAKRTIGRDGRVVWAGNRDIGEAQARAAGGYVRFYEPEPGLHTYAWVKGK